MRKYYHQFRVGRNSKGPIFNYSRFGCHFLKDFLKTLLSSTFFDKTNQELDYGLNDAIRIKKEASYIDTLIIYNL